MCQDFCSICPDPKRKDRGEWNPGPNATKKDVFSWRRATLFSSPALAYPPRISSRFGAIALGAVAGARVASPTRAGPGANVFSRRTAIFSVGSTAVYTTSMRNEAAVKAAVFLCRSCGEYPSVRNVVGVIKFLTGRGMRWAEASAALDNLAKDEGNDFTRRWQQTRAEGGTSSVVPLGNDSKSNGEQKTDLGNKRGTNGRQTGNTFTEDKGTNGEQTGGKRGTPTQKEEKRKEKESKDSPSLNGALFPVDAIPAKKPPKPRKEPNPVDLAAWAILAAAFPVILARHPDLGMTEADWKKRNKVGALALHEAGKTPVQVVAALKCAFGNPEARFYQNISRLDKLQTHWSALSEIAAARRNGPLDLPTVDELRKDLR